ncbi:MAG: SCP-2 sterol transfer family protein [Gammaproteobacteria bacterium]
MAAKFMTDAWFTEVEALIAAAGDLEAPPALHDLVLNVTVTGTTEGDKEMAIVGGKFQKGHSANAPTKMTVPVDLAHRLFIDNDQSAGMLGFMSGQIKIEGDMSKLMVMNTVQPSAKQKELQGKIKGITA